MIRFKSSKINFSYKKVPQNYIHFFKKANYFFFIRLK